MRRRIRGPEAKLLKTLDKNRSLVVSDLDLTGVDLSRRAILGLEFRHCKLIGANFSGADLSLARFIDCDLYLADFSESVLYATWSVIQNPMLLRRRKGRGPRRMHHSRSS